MKLLLCNGLYTFWKPKSNIKSWTEIFVSEVYFAQKDVEVSCLSLPHILSSQDLLLGDSKHSKLSKHFMKLLKANSIDNIQFIISLLLIHFPYTSSSPKSPTSFSDSIVVFSPSLAVSSLIPKFLVHFLVEDSRETQVKHEFRSIKSKLFHCSAYVR